MSLVFGVDFSPMKHLVSLLCSALCVGCINTDPAVFVVASVENETAGVESSSLVTGFDGGLNLRLHLGARASGSAVVSLQALQLIAADGNTLLHAPLSYEASAEFPVTIDQDATLNVSLLFPASSNQLPTGLEQSLCSSEGVLYRAVLEDSLRGASLNADSATPVAVRGCP